MIIPSECEGCTLLQEDSDEECDILQVDIDDGAKYCPCTTCLVKAMCTRGCLPFMKFRKELGFTSLPF